MATAARRGNDENQPALSENALRNKLNATLKSSGIVDTLKSQLRARVLSELRAGTTPGMRAVRRVPNTRQEEAANLLMMEHLMASGFSCTTSVFAPESGLPAGLKPERDIVLDMLDLHKDSKARKAIAAEEEKSTLLALVSYVASNLSSRTSTSTASSQTTAQSETLDSKISLINDKYRALVSVEQTAPLKGLEERIAAVQREADKRVRSEVEAAVERVRRVEISRVRVEEHTRYQGELAALKNEMERGMQKRVESLREKESQLNTAVSTRERELDLQGFAHRQRMLAEIDVVRERDKASRRMAQDAQDAAARGEARLREMQDALEAKIAEADRARRLFEIESEKELGRMVSGQKRRQEEADKANAAARAVAAEQQAQAEVSKALYNEAVSEARLAREECLVLRGESNRSATRAESLQRELESAKERLAESSAVAERLQTTVDALKLRIAAMPEVHAEASQTSPAALRPSDAKYLSSPVASRMSSGGGPAVEALVMQLEELRSSQARERLVHEKEALRLKAAAEGAERDKQRIEDRARLMQHDLESARSSLQHAEDSLIKAQKEASEASLNARMRAAEVSDLKRLLSQAQQALERDKQQEADMESEELLLTRGPGARRSSSMRRGGTASDVEQMLEDAKQQVREARSARSQGGAGSLYQSSGRTEESGGSALGGDGWEEDFKRVVQTIGDLEREDEGLRQARAKFMSGSRDRSKVAQFPDRPTRIVYAWNDPSQTAAALNQDATPPAPQPATQGRLSASPAQQTMREEAKEDWESIPHPGRLSPGKDGEGGEPSPSKASIGSMDLEEEAAEYLFATKKGGSPGEEERGPRAQREREERGRREREEKEREEGERRERERRESLERDKREMAERDRREAEEEAKRKEEEEERKREENERRAMVEREERERERERERESEEREREERERAAKKQEEEERRRMEEESARRQSIERETKEREEKERKAKEEEEKKAAAAKKAEEERVAAEKKKAEGEKTAAAKKAEEERAAAAKKAEEERAAAAAAKKAGEERAAAAAAKKAGEERAAAAAAKKAGEERIAAENYERELKEKEERAKREREEKDRREKEEQAEREMRELEEMEAEEERQREFERQRKQEEEAKREAEQAALEDSAKAEREGDGEIRSARDAIKSGDLTAAASHLQSARELYEDAGCVPAKQRPLDDVEQDLEDAKEDAKAREVRALLEKAKSALGESTKPTQPQVVRARDALAEARRAASSLSDPDSVEDEIGEVHAECEMAQQALDEAGKTSDSGLMSAYLQAMGADDSTAGGDPYEEDAPSPAHVSGHSSSIVEEDIDFGFGDDHLDDLEVESMDAGDNDISMGSNDAW